MADRNSGQVESNDKCTSWQQYISPTKDTKKRRNFESPERANERPFQYSEDGEKHECCQHCTHCETLHFPDSQKFLGVAGVTSTGKPIGGSKPVVFDASISEFRNHSMHRWEAKLMAEMETVSHYGENAYVFIVCGADNPLINFSWVVAEGLYYKLQREQDLTVEYEGFGKEVLAALGGWKKTGGKQGKVFCKFEICPGDGLQWEKDDIYDMSYTDQGYCRNNPKYAKLTVFETGKFRNMILFQLEFIELDDLTVRRRLAASIQDSQEEIKVAQDSVKEAEKALKEKDKELKAKEKEIETLKKQLNSSSSSSKDKEEKKVDPGKTPAKPAPAKPTPAKPSPAKPAPAKPDTSKPTPAKPTPAKPTPAKPAPTKPDTSKPAPAKPTAAKTAPEKEEVTKSKDESDTKKPSPSKPEVKPGIDKSNSNQEEKKTEPKPSSPETKSTPSKSPIQSKPEDKKESSSPQVTSESPSKPTPPSEEQAS